MRAAHVTAALLAAGCAVQPVPAERIHGRVLSRDGEPIENATVELTMFRMNAFACERHALLGLTRTAASGAFQFAPGAESDLHFAAEWREYAVTAVHPDFYGSFAVRTGSDAETLEIRLEPRRPGRVPASFGCFHLCRTTYDDCRRAAEFHFGDRTRCDAWIRELP